MPITLTFFGHSFWTISTEAVTVAIDPYDFIGYPLPDVSADVVLISHSHHDHGNSALIKGNPLVFQSAGIHRHKDLTTELFPVWHDEVKGAKRGVNHLIRLTLADRTFVHCGDLGHVPEPAVLQRLGQPDALFVPVGEIYTLSIPDVLKLISRLSPILVFPMHYQTSGLNFRLGQLSAFTGKVNNLMTVQTNTLSLTADLFARQQTIVMNWHT